MMYHYQHYPDSKRGDEEKSLGHHFISSPKSLEARSKTGRNRRGEDIERGNKTEEEEEDEKTRGGNQMGTNQGRREESEGIVQFQTKSITLRIEAERSEPNAHTPCSL